MRITSCIVTEERAENYSREEVTGGPQGIQGCCWLPPGKTSKTQQIHISALPAPVTRILYPIQARVISTSLGNCAFPKSPEQLRTPINNHVTQAGAKRPNDVSCGGSQG